MQDMDFLVLFGQRERQNMYGSYRNTIQCILYMYFFFSLNALLAEQVYVILHVGSSFHKLYSSTNCTVCDTP